MKVHLIKQATIEAFTKENSLNKGPFNSWVQIIKYANWNKPQDIVTTFNSADILGKSSNRVVFNIAGNKYRLICKYYFGKSQVHLFIKWIGTHAEYTSLCKNGNQFTVENY
ncbi:mRNA interferase HigB [Tangfeifania diversioriginum]|uniref:mRNA interferase HigB n=1 Tax=Tangfeifania diversioriginum TaxID=1168035 RepID=A0A1M6FEL1_9BACT|nr:type II toxin-antitoxin system HigB family toxin [Tangfeifania diversioriginum]SHI96093.1 mRNA interferase HigB [Tangfeifania diversioriginum]